MFFPFGMQRRREGNWIDYLSPFFFPSFSLDFLICVRVPLPHVCFGFVPLYFEFYSSISSFLLRLVYVRPIKSVSTVVLVLISVCQLQLDSAP